MTAEQIAQFAAGLLALLFGYAPGLQPWYDGLAKQTKALIMGGLIIAVGAGAYALGCYYPTLLPPGWVVSCSQTGLAELIKLVLAALTANVGVFVLAVRPFQKPSA